MFNLLKYELKKRKKSLIVGAIALAVAEGLALYFLSKQGDYVIFTMLLMGLMVAGAVLLTFLDVAINYFSDFKKSQGTLLFLTPNSGNKIVGSKMLFGAMELFAGMGIVILFIWLTNSVALGLGYEGIGPQIEMFREVLNMGVGQNNTWWVIAGFIFLVFLQYLASQSIAISSVTLGRTILSRNKYNWLYAVLLFIVVSVAVQTINGTVIALVGMGDGLFALGAAGSSSDEFVGDITKYLITGGLQYIFWIAATFFVSSGLLNKRIDI